MRCRECGRELGRDGHSYYPGRMQDRTPCVVNTTAGVLTAPLGVNQGLPAGVNTPPGRAGDRHRRGYMRDYMRRRRATGGTPGKLATGESGIPRPHFRVQKGVIDRGQNGTQRVDLTRIPGVYLGKLGK